MIKARELSQIVGKSEDKAEAITSLLPNARFLVVLAPPLSGKTSVSLLSVASWGKLNPVRPQPQPSGNGSPDRAVRSS